MQTAGMQRRYEENVRDHYHLLCVRCGRVDDAPVPPDNDLQEAVKRTTTYKILTHRVEFLGLCPVCCSHAKDSNGSRTRETARIAYKHTYK